MATAPPVPKARKSWQSSPTEKSISSSNSADGTKHIRLTDEDFMSFLGKDFYRIPRNESSSAYAPTVLTQSNQIAEDNKKEDQQMAPIPLPRTKFGTESLKTPPKLPSKPPVSQRLPAGKFV